MISTIDPVCRTQKHLAVAKQQQAEFLQRSDFQASGNRWQIMCRVDQASRKLGGHFRTENMLQQQFKFTVEREERSRHKRSAFAERENLQKNLERKVDSAVRGEMMAQRKLYQAEAEVEARNW